MSVRDPFVRPETVRLALGDGEWLDVKRRLSIGEAREAQALGLQYDERLERWIVDPKKTGVIDVAGYLVDWSFPLTIRLASRADVLAAVEALDLDDFIEIHRAIVAHERAEDSRRAAEKKPGVARRARRRPHHRPTVRLDRRRCSRPRSRRVRRDRRGARAGVVAWLN